MALDKLIDSSQLDGALGSTADAIREKTGGTSLLEWDMDTGFEVAIGEILTPTDGSIPTKTSLDLTVSGNTVTAPSGYYASDASASVASGSAITPDTTITANPVISVGANGLITAAVNVGKTVTPTVSAGYVTSGTSGTITASGSNTSQLSTQGAKTITPTESEQTAVASGKYTTGVVKVGAISSTYVGSDIPQNDSDDLTVSGRTVTAPSGYYAENATKSIGVGTVTSGSATISTITHTYNSSTGKFDIGGSANVSAPTVGTAGYISTAEGTKNAKSGGATVSTTENKIVGSTSITGASTRKPSIGKQTISITGVTDASSGDATTTAPSSGVYVAVKSSANTGTLTATPSVTTAGYGDSTNHGITGATQTVGASASDTTYVPITTTSASVSGKTVSYGSGWITAGSNSVSDGSVTQNAPTIDSSTGIVTATSTVTEGYVGADTKSNTLQLTTKGATTYNTSTSNQTISAGTYITGAQTIRAVTTSNISATNIKDGVVVKVGDEGSATRIKNVTGTFTDASTVSSGQTAAGASQIRSGYSAWVDGAEVKGSLGNTSVTQGTSTKSGTTVTRGRATWGNGVISSGSIGAATFSNEGTSGVTYLDISDTTDSPVLVAGDNLYINQGYTDNLKISLAKLVPDGSDVKGHGEYILSGHSAYDNDGTLVAGTIPTKTSSDMTVSGKTVTAPVGYYASNTSKSVAVGTVTSGTATISSLTKTYNSTNGNFDITGSANVSAPTVGTAGYISSSEGTRNAKSGGATVSATIDKIVGSTAITGTTTKKPSITKQSTPSGVTNAASGNATTTAPTSGVYVAVKSAANTGTLTATPSVTTAGYGTADYHGISGNTATVGASASDTTYVPITTTSASRSGRTVSYGSGWITSGSTSVPVGTVTSGSATISSASYAYNSTNGNFDVTGSASIGAPSVGTEGYISSSEGTRNGNTASLATTVAKIVGSTAISGATTKKPSITKQDVPSGVTQAASGAATTTAPTSGVYVAVKSAANTGTLTATPSVTTAGYGTADNHGITGATQTVGASASDTTYVPIATTSATVSGKTVSYGSGWISSGSKSVADGAYSASVSSHSITTTPVVTGSTSGTVTDISTTTAPTSGTDGTDYWTITPSGSVTTTGVSSAKGKATIGTAGYIATGNKETSASTVDITPTVSNGTARYIPKTSITNSGGELSNTTNYSGTPTVSLALDSQSTSGIEITDTAQSSGYYVKLVGSTAKLTGTTKVTRAAYKETRTAGYCPAMSETTILSSTTSSPSVTVNAASKTRYLTLPTATFAVSANKVYCSAGGWVPTGSTSSVVGTVSTGTISNNQTLPSGSSSSGTITRGKYIKIGAGYYSADAYYLAQNVSNGTITNNTTLPSGSSSSGTINRGSYIKIGAGYYSADAYYLAQNVSNGSITNNTTLPSGSSSSGTINRGSYIKIGAGYYASDAYYLAQANSGTLTVSASGTTSCNGYANVSVASATPTFDGGTLSGGSTATGTNVTLSTTDNGMKVQTAYTAASTAVLYNGAVNGWVSKADNAQALAAQSKSSTNGTAYYVTAVTMPKDKGFTVTTTADTALDTTSDLDVTNNAYRRVDITNNANGTVIIANSGSSTVTSGSATAGSLSVNAYNNASTPTLTGAQSVVTNGKWVINNVSSSGTYYGMTVVPSTMITPSGNIQLTQSTSTDVSAYATATVRGVTATISGGGLSGTATATGSSCSISDSTNSSGVSITTACTASRAKVSCTTSTAGWASGTIKELAADTGAMTAKTYYINGVTLTKPSSGTRTFSVTVPNGNSTAMFTFNVDTSGNVTITES